DGTDLVRFATIAEDPVKGVSKLDETIAGCLECNRAPGVARNCATAVVTVKRHLEISRRLVRTRFSLGRTAWECRNRNGDRDEHQRPTIVCPQCCSHQRSTSCRSCPS